MMGGERLLPNPNLVRWRTSLGVGCGSFGHGGLRQWVDGRSG